VNWKFWKRFEEPGFYIETKAVPTSTLVRWYLYDTKVKHPNKRAEALGFNPISAEGEEMEIKESQNRLKNLEPYENFLAMFSDISGLVTAESFSEQIKFFGISMPEDIDEDEAKKQIADMFTNIALSCLVPAFSAALQLGIVVNPGTFVTEVE